MTPWSDFCLVFEKAQQEAFSKTSRLLCVSSPGETPLVQKIAPLVQEEFLAVDLLGPGAQSPWAPVLDMAREFWKGIQVPEDLLLPLNRPLFQNFFEGKPWDWTLPILESIPYETAGILRDLQSLIKNAPSRPRVILIQNSQELKKETLNLLQTLVEPSATPFPLLLVLHFDQRQVHRMGDLGAEVLGFYWEKVFLGEVIPLELEGEPPGNPGLTAQDFLSALEKFRNFLCLDQGAAWGEKALEKAYYQLFTPEELFQIHTWLGAFYLMQNELDMALLQLQEPSSAQVSLEGQFHRDYLLAWTLMRRGPWQEALNLVQTNQKTAKEAHQSRWEALFQFAGHDISRRYIRDHFQKVQEYEDLIQALDRENLQVQKISALVNHPFEYQSSIEIRRHKAPIEEGLALAQKIGHDFSISTAYHRMGTHLAAQEGEKVAIGFYFKAAEVRRRLGQALPLVRINNGISHSFLNQGDFSSALEYLAENFNLLEQVPDYSEIVVTLFNLGQVYFFGRDFPMAQEAFQKVLRFMPLLGLSQIPFNSHADILLLLAYCKLTSGENLLGQGILETITAQKHTLNPHSLFLLDLAFMAQSIHSGASWQEMDAHFQNAKVHIPVNRTFQTRSLAFLYHEAASWLKKGGLAWKAKEIWQEAQNLRSHRDLLLFNRWFDLPWEVHREWKFPFTHLATPMGALESLVKQERNLISLQKRLREIQFLSHSLEIFQNVETLEALGPLLTAHLMEFSPSRSIHLWAFNSGNWKLLGFSGEPLEIGPEKLEALAIGSQEKNQGTTQGDLIPRHEILAFPLKEGTRLSGLLMLVSQKDQFFSSHQAQILSILAHHAENQILRLQRQEELLIFSLRDSLTSLGNRKSLEIEIAKAKSRIFHLTQQGITPHYSLAFIDLDNFKYHNDTFGHQMGDFLLTAMAALLKDSFYSSDQIFRYGGDEFVVLLGDTSLEGAQHAAEKLLQKIHEEDHFQKKIRQILDQQVSIPREKLLSCSIGLASWKPDLSFQDLLRQADQALYQAKAFGKNTFAIFKETS